MKRISILSASLRLCGLIILTAIATAAQTVPAPKDVLGFTPGDDRKLASWAKVIEYFQKLDAASERVMFQEIGKTTMGAPFVYATISSPANLKDLKKYKDINAQLADPRTIQKIRLRNGREMAPDVVAQMLVGQGKTIVLITCGVHSNEVGSYLSSMLIAHRLASSNDAETKKILDNTIVLLVPSLNPDGVDIINNWYQKTLGTPYEGTDPPELYHKYVGHDDNRDWYAFTQVETQLTVDKIHNVWHPQIVNDIHQQGANGSRLFLPPYMQPVEPNVPKQIVEGYTELGNYIAADLRKQGFQGITTDSTYDAWTPSRAYSHYHGGVRILSETASAKLATPITVKFEDLRAGEGYDPKKETPNFGPVWRGGEWHLSDITRYMTTAAFSILNNAANERERWLTRFYEIGKEAVRPRKSGELNAYIFDGEYQGFGPWASNIWPIFRRAGVEFTYAPAPFSADGKRYPQWAEIIRMDQPYSAFARAMLDATPYPDLRDNSGNPIPPYDVTAHTLGIFIKNNYDRINNPFRLNPTRKEKEIKNPTAIAFDHGPDCQGEFHYGIYRSNVPAMDEGWTRWVVENFPFYLPQNVCKREHASISNKEIRNSIGVNIRSIIFPDQSPNQILNGYAKGSMPDEYTGGIGKEGVENLKKFVEAGGTLVFLNRSSDFAIEQFNLPIRDVTKGLARKDFYIPGSILRTELSTDHPITKGMPAQSIAWFENSPVFDFILDKPAVVVPTSAETSEAKPSTQNSGMKIKVLARYPWDSKQILLSGWALGAEKIAGKYALLEVTMGKGKIILFGFRPQYRGQSLATFPLLFNSISQ